MKAEVVPYIIARVTVDIPTPPTEECEVFDYTVLKYPLDTRYWYCAVDFDDEEGLPDGIEDSINDLLSGATTGLVILAEAAVKKYHEFDTMNEVGEELATLDCGEIDGCHVTIEASLAFKVYVPNWEVLK